jgi:hypothetical protein
MSKLTIDEQYAFGEKLKQLVIFVGLLTDAEIEALKGLRQDLREQNSTLSTTAGVLTDFDASEHQIARHDAMIKRIDAVLAIHESNLEMDDADQKYATEKASREQLNRMFGL